MDMKSIVCPNCKSHDFKLINDSIAKCNYCGAYVVYKEDDDPNATHYYAVCNNKKSETFYREALEEICENGDTPYDVFSASEFGTATLVYEQVCHVSGEADVTYNAQIGVDRKVEYQEYSSSAKKYVTKTKTVTDWTPISGTYNYSGTTDAVKTKDGADLVFLDRAVIENAYVFDGELDFDTVDPEQITGEELSTCEADLRADARSQAQSQASRSGDHIRNFNASARSRITSTSRIVVPAYIFEYKYENETYRVHSYAVEGARNSIDYPDVSKDIEETVKKQGYVTTNS